MTLQVEGVGHLRAPIRPSSLSPGSLGEAVISDHVELHGLQGNLLLKPGGPSQAPPQAGDTIPHRASSSYTPLIVSRILLDSLLDHGPHDQRVREPAEQLFFLGHCQNAICRSWERALIDQTALAAAHDHALAQMVRHAPVAVWVIDDTGIPKKGSHSVGVARRYCGASSNKENWQVMVF
jgi:hypothetical protein